MPGSELQSDSDSENPFGPWSSLGNLLAVARARGLTIQCQGLPLGSASGEAEAPRASVECSVAPNRTAMEQSDLSLVRR